MFDCKNDPKCFTKRLVWTQLFSQNLLSHIKNAEIKVFSRIQINCFTPSLVANMKCFPKNLVSNVNSLNLLSSTKWFTDSLVFNRNVLPQVLSTKCFTANVSPKILSPIWNVSLQVLSQIQNVELKVYWKSCLKCIMIC